MSNMDLTDPSQLRDHLNTILSDPTLLPDKFLNWLPNHLTLNPPDINIDQINGYQENSSSGAQTIQPEETTTSASYTRLTTLGPVLQKLEDGLYIVAYGCSAKINNSNTRAKANVAINGVAIDGTTPQIFTSNSGGMVGCSATATVRLDGGVSGNTLELMYAVGVAGGTPANTGTFGARYLNASRIAN